MAATAAVRTAPSAMDISLMRNPANAWTLIISGPGSTVAIVAVLAGVAPADFVGLSFEMRELGIGNLDPHRGNMVDLLRTLGRSNVRISGNTLDRDTLWASGRPVPRR
jgi:hypothetical protein